MIRRPNVNALAAAFTLLAASCGATTLTDAASPSTAAPAVNDTFPSAPATSAAPVETPGPTSLVPTVPPTAAPPTAVPPTTAEPPTGAPTTAPSEPVDNVVLVDAGAEPRSLLRRSFVPPDPEFMVQVVDTVTRQVVEGEVVLETGASTVIEQRVTTAIEGENFAVAWEIIRAEAGPDVSPADAEQLNAALAPSVGLVETVVVTPRGLLVDRSFGGVAAADLGTIGTSIDNAGESGLTNPFPLEPVGIGARWQTRQVVVTLVEAEMVSTYELVSFDGTVLELAVEVEQVVRAGANYQVPTGTATVADWDVAGSGTVTVDLRSSVFTSAIRLEGTQQILVDAVPGQEPVLVDLRLATETTTAPSP